MDIKFTSVFSWALNGWIFRGFSWPGLEIKKMSGHKFATSYENLVATLKTLVAKLIEAM